MITEIKTETFIHPDTKESITRDYIYTKDDSGNIVNKEFYDPTNTEAGKLLKVLQGATATELFEIKKVLGITTIK